MLRKVHNFFLPTLLGVMTDLTELCGYIVTFALIPSWRNFQFKLSIIDNRLSIYPRLSTLMTSNRSPGLVLVALQDVSPALVQQKPSPSSLIKAKQPDPPHLIINLLLQPFNTSPALPEMEELRTWHVFPYCLSSPATLNLYCCLLMIQIVHFF